MSVHVAPVELPRDARRFVRTWWRVHADDPLWVPPVFLERKQFLDPRRNPYFAHADVQCWQATRDGEPVGTISAQIDHRALESQPDTGFFGFFEFTDDEVAGALLDIATRWLRDRGMRTVLGPFSLAMQHAYGLLVDGFDTPPTVGSTHNPPRFVQTYERLGLQRDLDWYAYWIGREQVSDRISRVADRLLQRHPEITIEPLDLSRIDRFRPIILDVYNEAFTQIPGHVPLTEGEYEAIIDELLPIVDPRFVLFAFVDGEPAAASLSLPDINPALTRMNGRLFPFGWFHWLRRARYVQQIRFFVLGVRPRFQHLPLGAPLIDRTWRQAWELGYRGAEASVICESNHRMRGVVEKVGMQIYKTYRTYRLAL